ncbi:MAG TPA: malto-oligosyltrehalose trehalohydrolase [Steroidobacteraceae bacterium]|nr:malto-oligosyltrehalose trehalohydrolase [Steroidobacteraceae bacterium]
MRYTHGPRALPHGGACFRLWAPSVPALGLVLDDGAPHPMQRGADGWHELEVPDAAEGVHYGFRLPDGRVVPDPASRRQPNNVHGLSEWIDTARLRFTVPWHGRRWEEIVLYELHVGAFTAEGTFRGAIERLDHLAGLGVTALQIMPVADFPGLRNWGYDGVYPYAPDASYGTPADFAALVDAAHARGLAVFLDVVYNHFGPEGNYLHSYAPQFFTERHHTPWGAGINVDDPQARPVRDFFVENAVFWLREYRLDGLRLDAVHAIADDSALHLLNEIAARVREVVTERPVHLVLENEDNEARHLARTTNGAPAAYTAQWNDDIHHVLHVAATREHASYYEEYLDDTRLTARAIGEGFAFQGEVMRCRGRPRGEDSKALPPAAFVSFIQNHDQVGNRAFGERLGALAAPEKLRAVAAVYLLAPQIPMLFMGEEWNARQPFLFFCDFHGELADAVRNGRRAEFRKFPEFSDPARRDLIPDPQDPVTFQSSKLHWDDRRLPECAEWLRWYSRVLATRRQQVVPLIFDIKSAGTSHVVGTNAVFVSWRTMQGNHLRLSANLSDQPQAFPLDRGRVIWHEGGAPAGNTLPPWTVRWTRVD